MSGSASRTWRCGSGRERRLKRGRDATRRDRSTLRVRSRCRCRGPRRPARGRSGRHTRRGVSGRETGRTGTRSCRLPFMVVVRFISWEFRHSFPLYSAMAASFDGGAGIMIPTHVHPYTHTAGDIKYHLQAVLLSKGEQLEQAATLGQRVLAQQMELEERIRQLQDMDADKADDDELDPETTDRYRDLVDTIQAWDAENAQLSSSFASSGVGVFIFHSSFFVFSSLLAVSFIALVRLTLLHSASSTAFVHPRSRPSPTSPAKSRTAPRLLPALPPPSPGVRKMPRIERTMSVRALFAFFFPPAPTCSHFQSLRSRSAAGFSRRSEDSRVSSPSATRPYRT